MTHLERYQKGKMKEQELLRIIRHYDNCVVDDLDDSACRNCKYCLKEPDGISCEAGCDNFLTHEGCWDYEEDK